MSFISALAKRSFSSAQFRKPVIALMSGSTREGSVNTQLIHAAETVAKGLGAETKVLDLGNYDMPVYNQDLEAASGLPKAAQQLKAELESADGWIVASPEYNGFITPLLVNSIAWCSRGDPDGEMYATFKGKSAVVLSASPGAMGGMRSLNPNRELLTNLGVSVLPDSVAVGGAFGAFDDEGALVDVGQKAMLEAAVEKLFYQSRDAANREATYEMIDAHLVGEYGEAGVVA
ncbi:unnamed protein product [Cylindrotheca closterium]|uniref:NADPH-dependent FMN reductase-like domain-containing protein n=1 Tax=Cylindrotheca closterium TaxID=2856 RepID=A0AAD2FYI5_9STRA|nr:unnamed protein product [Cylindrotheca closterium]